MCVSLRSHLFCAFSQRACPFWPLHVARRFFLQLTPLHYATMEGKELAVYALLACGADLTAVDKEQDTVLHWAAMKGECNSRARV